MSVVPSISLVNVASNEKHCLNSSESVIGRGWLNCNDKRISRNHGVLKVISSNSVAVLSTHQNSMFFRKKNNIEVNQIEQNNEVNLFVGDSFGLLVDEFWFSIQPSDKGNDVIGGLHANITQSIAPSSSGTKRRSSSDSEPDSTNKKVKTEPNEFQDDVAINEVANDVNGLSNGDLDTTLPTDTTNEMPSTSASNIPQDQNDSTVVDRPIKPEPLDPDEIQPTPTPTIKTEPMSQEANIDSTMESTPVTVKTESTEVKTEPANNENNDDGATTSSGNTHQPPQRACCRYGIRCYRRNPAHRVQEAHPGDADYRLPDYPDPPLGAAPCPYLDRCYRRNPAHFAQFSHKASWRTDSSGKEGYEATAKTPKRTTTNTATNDVQDSEDDPYATDDDSDADFLNDDPSESDEADE
ncbi:aprataxin and PNK-like factor [Sitodiplosis mosellana]|uniref:aprataxin and PNK-like factor n=1 Tax=Sitodiplosis mosellana TaxID=263140 RepID=UPI002443CF52|nr:aprataxin and PNK-like factor [Sitodiplosis mosellana]